jgi:hypothetical protein
LRHSGGKRRTRRRAVRRLGGLLDGFPAGALAPLRAHLGLRTADWAIRAFARAQIGDWLDLGEQRVT